MISRRRFIGALAALPVVGKLFAKPNATVEAFSIPLDGTSNFVDLANCKDVVTISLWTSGAKPMLTKRYIQGFGGELVEVTSIVGYAEK